MTNIDTMFVEQNNVSGLFPQWPRGSGDAQRSGWEGWNKGCCELLTAVVGAQVTACVKLLLARQQLSYIYLILPLEVTYLNLLILQLKRNWDLKNSVFEKSKASGSSLIVPVMWCVTHDRWLSVSTASALVDSTNCNLLMFEKGEKNLPWTCTDLLLFFNNSYIVVGIIHNIYIEHRKYKREKEYPVGMQKLPHFIKRFEHLQFHCLEISPSQIQRESDECT